MTILILMSFLCVSAIAKDLVISPSELPLLLKAADRDGDKKITIDDEKGGSLRYRLKLQDGGVVTIDGAYHLSNLLQEMKLREHEKVMLVPEELIFERPVTRIARLIKDLYWDGLTRKIDEKHLASVIQDTKGKSDKNYLYVPVKDKVSWDYYSKIAKERKDLNLSVIKVPSVLTHSFLKRLDGKHGLLALAPHKSYVVPGGRFNELYGWDSYFITQGLLRDGKIELAKNMVDHHVYEIEHYGKILNANRTYYLTRSQPPLLTSMIREVFENLPKTPENLSWLKVSLEAAVREYRTVWMGKERLTKTGLSRYTGFAPGIPPEVEPGHFDEVLKPYLKKYKLTSEVFIKKFNDGKIREPELTRFFLNDRAVRESGHDTTYRWKVEDKDLCSDFVTVDLNSLLLKYELDLAYLYQTQFKNQLVSLRFLKFAKTRTANMRKHFWNAEKNLFYDYNFVNKKMSSYLSATTFFPLWAFEPTYPEIRVLNDEETKKLISRAMLDLEQAGGLVATSKKSLNAYGDVRHLRQWEYPNGWAPHQMLTWKGLANFKFKREEQRLIYKWLYMITTNAMSYNGTIPEKYDVVKRSHDVFAEYGNVGTKFDYITKEGFGWMNASYVEGLAELEPQHRKALEQLTPPEKVNF